MNLTDVFLTLVDMSISAAWVALAVMVLRLVLKKVPRWMHCCLWLLVAVRLVCPFTVESAFSVVSVEGAREVVYDMLDGYVGPGGAYWDYTEEYEAAVKSGIEPIYAGESGGRAHYYVVTGETPTTEITIFADQVALVWVAGMGIMLAYTFISYFQLRRKVAASLMVGEGIYLCDYIDTPFILGIVKPKIYLPSDMDPNVAAHVLAHERAHIKRRDHWWKPLGFGLLTLHWFNPILWLAYVLLCRDIELACDEKVIREMGVDDKKAYSEALLQCSVSRRMIAACPLAFGEVGVKERVKSVLNYKKPAFWIIVIAVVALIVAAVCLLTDPVGFSIEDVAQISEENQDTVILTAEGDTLELTGAVPLQTVFSFLESAGLEATPISQNRIERASDYGITIGKTSIWFDSYFSYIWVDDGVKPSLPYLLKDQEEVRDFFNRMFGTEFTEPAPTEPEFVPSQETHGPVGNEDAAQYTNVLYTALEELMSREIYHIRWQEYVNGSIRATDVWKHGQDYLAKRLYTAHSGETTEGGHMIRNSIQYVFDWTGDYRDRNLTEWMLRTYSDSFKDWVYTAEWGLEDAAEAAVDGDVITLTGESGHVYTYRIDREQDITAFSYQDPNGTILLSMEVQDTDANTVRSLIDDQKGGPRAFSWEEELVNDWDDCDVKTSGFVLSYPQSISSSLDAFRLAMVEAEGQLSESFVIQNVCYDQHTGTWKVVFNISEDALVIVYMDSQGVTKRVVTSK